GYTERARQLATADAQLAAIAAALPAGTTLLVTAPGAPSKPPHLQLALADGPGYSSGLLNAVSTRQPGLIVLTALTPTVLGWRVAGVFAVAVPAGTFLANLAPWSTTVHPAAWLYGVSVALALVIAGAALLGCRNRGPLAPLGVICLFTVAVLGVDVTTGSGLQLETPFGLSVLEAGRFYGIGNEALGIYGLSGLFGAAWLALVLLHRR